MPPRKYRAFIAYPASPRDLADPIKSAAAKLESHDSQDVLAWPGQRITEEEATTPRP